MINAIMFLGELITATLLYAQAAVFRSRALAVLAAGYVFTALLIIPHTLTIPGAFSPDGLLGAGSQHHGVDRLPAASGISHRHHSLCAVQAGRLGGAIRNGTSPDEDRPGGFAAAALAAAVTILTTAGHDLLPPYFVDRPT
jgi:hypothetical protein